MVSAALVLGIAIPTEREKDDDGNHISHRADAPVAP